MAYTRSSGTIDFRFEFTGTGAIVDFPAYIDNISVSFSPSWSTFKESGRADPKVLYAEFQKSISLSFKVVSESSSPEEDPVTRFNQLHNLVKGSAPMYYGSDIGYQGSFVKFSIGKIYVQQYGFISSLQLNWEATDMVWDVDPDFRDNVTGNLAIRTGTHLPMWTVVDMDITWVGRVMPNQNTKFFR